MYEKGRGVTQDLAEAATWHRKAEELHRKKAERGDARAQYNLGFMYETGYGVTQDYAEAATWYRKAADSYYKAVCNSSRRLVGWM
ncbi:MAG: sel1 repeat family protein [Betaproteobacteria bacterium]|nr:sel1 repeat family protein [Betaproteobacteria bacterium]